MHRGLIPLILKRGPIASIDLDPHIIRELLSRGVDLRKPDGSVFRLYDLVINPPKSAADDQEFCIPKPGEPFPPEPAADVPNEPVKAEESDDGCDKVPQHVLDKQAEQEKEAAQTEEPAAVEEPAEESAPAEEKTEASAPTTPGQIPMTGPDGQHISKNQRKKLQRAAAEAAAKAGAQTPSAPESEKKESATAE